MGTGKGPKEMKAAVAMSAAYSLAGTCATATATATAAAGASVRDGTFASPAARASRKRPRSSPPGSGDGDASSASPASASPAPSTNPFKAFGHRHGPSPSRPLPPSPSSRLGLGVGSSSSESLTPSRRTPASSFAVGLDVFDSSESGVGSDDDFESPAPKARRSSKGWTSTSTPTGGKGGGRVEDRGAASNHPAATVASVLSSSPPGGGCGSVSSPVLLVDLSQEEGDDDKYLSPSGALAGSGSVMEMDLGESQPGGGALRGGTSSNITVAKNKQKKKLDDGAPAGVLLSRSGGSGVGVLSAELGGGQACKGSGDGEVEGEEELLASRLCFLVSTNSGRVHVYKKEELKEEPGGGWGGDDDGDAFDDEEDRKPQHCRLGLARCGGCDMM